MCSCFHTLLSASVSRYPHRDVSFTLALLAVPAAFLVGFGLTWVLILNMVACVIMAVCVQRVRLCQRNCVRVPADVDARLRTTLCTRRVSQACFPVVEVHLGVALITMLAVAESAAAMRTHVHVVLGVTVACFVATIATRLYALTHMWHQLAGSAVTGALSVPILFACARYAFPTGVSDLSNGIMFSAVLAGVVCYISYRIENDDMPLLRLTTEETERVVQALVAHRLRVAAAEEEEEEQENDRLDGMDAHRQFDADHDGATSRLVPPMRRLR